MKLASNIRPGKRPPSSQQTNKLNHNKASESGSLVFCRGEIIKVKQSSRMVTITPTEPSEEPRSSMRRILLRRVAFKWLLVVALAAKLPTESQQMDDSTLRKMRVELTDEELSRMNHVDSKIWIRTTEFSDRNNWRRRMKPCNFLQRISIEESALVSVGSALDALNRTSLSIQTNIMDLTLANDGILLLEEDTASGFGASDVENQIPFVEYLKHYHDCQDTIAEDPLATSDDRRAPFEFKVPSDQLSWFNPSNWQSIHMAMDIEELVPDSHLIPCADDLVQFGNEEQDFWSIFGERANLSSFKVNFEPSSSLPSDQNSKLSELRVASLKIGNLSLNQGQLEKLLEPESVYHNIMFQLDSPRSVLKSGLLIDRSSISDEYDGLAVCLDEAGCLCNNESPKVMELICSFVEPMKEEELPCRDPIESAGYCGKICASSLLIRMEPSKFSEGYLHNMILKMLEESPTSEQFANRVFIAARRISYGKFEITFRLVADYESVLNQVDAVNSSYDHLAWIVAKNFESDLGKDSEFAQLVFEKLSKDAVKSFYGIRSMSIKSSVDWKRNDRTQIFLISYSTITLISLMCLLLVEQQQEMDREEDSPILEPASGGQHETYHQLVRCPPLDWLPKASTFNNQNDGWICDEWECKVERSECCNNDEHDDGSDDGRNKSLSINHEETTTKDDATGLLPVTTTPDIQLLDLSHPTWNVQ